MDQPAYPDAGLRGDGVPVVPVRLTGYRASGRVLQLFYRVSPRDDCSTAVLHPAAVHAGAWDHPGPLERTPKRDSVEGCDGRVLDDTVSVRLARPVGDRLVEDADNFGQIVPTRQSTSATTDHGDGRRPWLRLSGTSRRRRRSRWRSGCRS